MLVSQDIPGRHQLRQIREHLGLSQSELASALGFLPQRGPRTVRYWEDEDDFIISPTAWAALRYMLMVVEIYRETNSESAAHAKIARLLPESLR